MHRSAPEFRPFRIHLLTVTDTRSPAEDGSGNYLAEALQAAGHVLYARDWCRDERYDIRAIVSAAIAEPQTDIVLITGGTGMFERDITPDAVEIHPRLRRSVPRRVSAGNRHVHHPIACRGRHCQPHAHFLPARLYRRLPYRLGKSHRPAARSAH